MNPTISIRTSPNKGRGVFAKKNFSEGELIEACPVICINSKERKKCDKTILAYYLYPWKSTRTGAMVLGYGSLYNHSFAPNADWKQNFKTMCMEYRATKDIRKGEEILVNYNGEPDDETPVDWFP
jgi:SET domain-containing protein